jgi:hypothetical protein
MLKLPAELLGERAPSQPRRDLVGALPSEQLVPVVRQRRLSDQPRRPALNWLRRRLDMRGTAAWPGRNFTNDKVALE